MTPTRRFAIALVVVALVALVVPATVTVLLIVVLVVAAGFDAVAARKPLRVARRVPGVVARGVPASLMVQVAGDATSDVRVRQANAPDLSITPPTGTGGLDAELRASRRGRHELPPAAARRRGPLGLVAWFAPPGVAEPVQVYPDVPAARRLVIALRQGRFREPGQRTRGPLGLGTDFESVREYLPDDDVRQINWLATARLGRPMSNQYRVEQDRDVVCLLDTGRLMTAPIGDLTRLDAAVDAVVAVALVADEIGDRVGLVAFDREIRRRMTTRRSGGRAVVEAVVDLEPRLIDSDYDVAFRAVSGGKRGLVIVFTDLVDEAAARSLLAAVPVLTRRHAVVVASVTDPDLQRAMVAAPSAVRDVY